MFGGTSTLVALGKAVTAWHRRAFAQIRYAPKGGLHQSLREHGTSECHKAPTTSFPLPVGLAAAQSFNFSGNTAFARIHRHNLFS